jgi:hypothetical protein
MWRPPAPEPPDDAPDAPDATDPAAPATPVAVDLAAFPIVGLTRRRMAIIAAALLAVWIVIAFTRQVAEASEAAARAQGISTGNAMRRLEVAAMERELEAIARQRFIDQQARAYGVGTVREIPFTLAPDAPPLEPDAPGSAALRVGADVDAVSPLEGWLTVLFGPSA